MDLVVTLAREAVAEVPAGVELRNWGTDEPSKRGIEGIERMRLVRDDIDARVQAPLADLAPATTDWATHRHPIAALQQTPGRTTRSP